MLRINYLWQQSLLCEVNYKMKLNEIKDATRDELSQRENELRKELFNLRFQRVISGLENPMRISQVRKEIARIKTIMNGRRITSGG